MEAQAITLSQRLLLEHYQRHRTIQGFVGHIIRLAHCSGSHTFTATCDNEQVAPLGLYAEQLSGTAFTAPRRYNFRSCTGSQWVVMQQRQAAAVAERISVHGCTEYGLQSRMSHFILWTSL